MTGAQGGERWFGHVTGRLLKRRLAEGEADVDDGCAPAEAGLTAASLAAAPQHQQKQMLGERLYPLIHAAQPELAGKITGMLLEMDNSELLLLLDSQDQLSEKIAEAIKVLDEHEAQAASS